MLYLQVIVLLLALLLKSDGSENMSYFLERKRMLEEVNITLHPRPKGSKVDNIYYTRKLNHIHNQSLLINEPNLCSQHRQVFLLFMIRTHYAHYEWRSILREQLKHPSAMPYRHGIIVKHVFMFGKADDPRIEEGLRNESLKHNDIIQEDFQESYVNLLRKVTMAWKWAVTFCPNAEYVMIENDELLVDVDKLVSLLLKDYSIARYHDRFAVCYPIGNGKSNHLSLKQFRMMDPKNLYKGKFYPTYCHGWGYVAHILVINQLYKASFTNPPFMPTDLWIGVLSEKLRLKIPNHKAFFVTKRIEKYFANPFYPIEQGMIAVTDFNGYKGHELQVMRNVIESMRQHWNRTKTLYYINEKEIYYKQDSFDCFSYIYISFFTVGVLLVLLGVSFKMRILPRFCQNR